MPTAHSRRTMTISRATQTAITTAGFKFALPSTVAAQVVRVKTSAAAYVGFGDATSVPAAAESNSVYHEAGVEDYVMDRGPQKAYLYVYSQAATTDAFISFLG